MDNLAEKNSPVEIERNVETLKIVDMAAENAKAKAKAKKEAKEAPKADEAKA